MFKKFWIWYEAHTTLNTGVASGLFTLQLVHLYWLTTAVVLLRIIGKSFFSPFPAFEFFITLVDYLEIPAIITTSMLYVNEVRKKFNYRSLLFLIFINSQWLHLFWITDEYVLKHFFAHSGTSYFPIWLAWVAIFIDYLELPVIFDTLKKFFNALRNEGITPAFVKLKEN